MIVIVKELLVALGNIRIGYFDVVDGGYLCRYYFVPLTHSK